MDTLRRSLITTALVLPLGALLVPTEGLAATRLIVTVRNQTNQALLGGAVVCVGTTANRAAHARQTTTTGIADFESVPVGNWIVTAWRAGFGTFERPLSVTAATFPTTTAAMTLTTGSATDPCAGAAPAPVLDGSTSIALPPDPPRLTQFFIGGVENPPFVTTTENVVLYAPHAGNLPTHYRVSESASFAGAAWKPYQPEVAGLVGIGRLVGPTGRRTLYFQYRSDHARGAVSSILNDSVDLTGVADYTINDVATLIAYAEANGFTFTATTGSGTTACGPGLGPDSPFRGRLPVIVGGDTPRGVAIQGGHREHAIFGGRLLNHAWGYKDVQLTIIQGANYLFPPPTSKLEVTRTSPGNPRDARAKVRFTAQPNPSADRGCPHVAATISSVVLTGPSGRDWREAFTR